MPGTPQSKPNYGAAHAVMERVFGKLQPGLRYRLWDGSEGDVGSPDGTFTLVIRSPDSLRKAFSGLETGAVANAYVDNHLDVEGDLLACLRMANQLEDAKFGALDKFQIWRQLRRL